mgnify:CR=1 FL=1
MCRTAQKTRYLYTLFAYRLFNCLAVPILSILIICCLSVSLIYGPFLLSDDLLAQFDLSRVDRTICPVCHKRFACLRSRNKHMFIHAGVKPFKCTSCGRCFRRKDHLKIHALTHVNINDMATVDFWGKERDEAI